MIEEVTAISEWWSVGATVFAGVLTALSTIGAVVYTNNKTKQQLIAQDKKFTEERREENKQTKFITIQHRMLLKTFNFLLDELIVDNDYYRKILFSGKDGFDFYDDPEKSATQQSRLFRVDNPGTYEIKDVAIKTSNTLRNLDNDKEFDYNTENVASILRPRESIIIRLANEEQWAKIIDWNKTNTTHEFVFNCTIQYTTEALQRVTYEYKMKILKDKKFEIIQDGVTSIDDIETNLNLQATVFRNLQDSISSIDRAKYIWEKQGEAQMKGLMKQYNYFQSPPINDIQPDEGKVEEDTNG